MLRTRLFLNLIPFVVILLAVGVYAIALFYHLANTVDVTVTDNYRNSTAVQSMGVALSHMETGLRLAMGDDKTSGASYFKANSAIFEQNMGAISTNAALSRDLKLIEQLKTYYENFHSAGMVMLGLDQRREQRLRFEQDIVPRMMAISLMLEQISRNNQKDILATSERIREINRHITHLMIIGIGVALFVAGYASFQVSKTILKPIQLLTKATREIGEGNLDQIVPLLSRDELGELAKAFNKMAAQLRTYRQSTSEHIMRLHRTMESALASFPDPIFVLDREGHIELKNPAAKNLSTQLELKDTLPERLSSTANKVLDTGEDFLPQNFKQVLSFRVNGDERAFLPRIHTMRGERDQTVGVAVVLHDVTRFRLMDDVKTNLVATVSHELKTPLTGMRMVLHLLIEKTLGPLNTKQMEMLEMARKDSDRLLRILNDLLDLARLEAGDSQLHKERITPAALFQSIADEAQQNTKAHGLRLTCSIKPGLSAVLVDRQRISLVFHNLITNAIKFSPPGGEIKLTAALADDGNIRFSVTDQGPGVPEEYQTRIFDRFFRVPGQAKTGAGLGLSITREIVAAHGGLIGVRNGAGQGSEFYVLLTGENEAAD